MQAVSLERTLTTSLRMAGDRLQSKWLPAHPRSSVAPVTICELARQNLMARCSRQRDSSIIFQHLHSIQVIVLLLPVERAVKGWHSMLQNWA